MTAKKKRVEHVVEPQAPREMIYDIDIDYADESTCYRLIVPIRAGELPDEDTILLFEQRVDSFDNYYWIDLGEDLEVEDFREQLIIVMARLLVDNVFPTKEQ